jgi:hypothetical protein
MGRFMPGQRMGDFMKDHVANRCFIVRGDEVQRQFDPPLSVTAKPKAAFSPIETEFPRRQPKPLH